MKGEYVEGKDHTNNMFSKLHQTNKFLHHHHHPPHISGHHNQPPPPPQHTHHFQLTNEPRNSEEADSRTSADRKDPPTTNDGASIEVVRRPRGRPPGSKNKPKPPIILTRDSEPAMNPYVLELPGGSDIVDSVTQFCRKRNTGLCILTGSGTVSNVTLRQPTTTPPAATVTFHGRFDILSISATVLPAMTHPFANGFTISLSGPQGQIVGGSVVGPLLAAGTVYIIAASFNNPSYHRLPVVEEVGNSGSGGGGEGRSPSGVSGGGDSGHPPAAAESCGMSIYSQMGSDVIWAPTARPPPY